MFKNRIDAGTQLTEKLSSYKNKSDVIVLGLPRGGVVVANQISKELNLPLDIIVTRKIGAPEFPELAIGAITQDGQPILDDKLISSMEVDQEYIDQAIEKEKREAKRRLNTYRGNRPPLNLKDKIAIIVDDGIATGATMKAAIKTAKEMGAKMVIVAIPVAPPEIINQIKREADLVVCLDEPTNFYAIGMFYKQFPQTEDNEVIKLMKREY